MKLQMLALSIRQPYAELILRRIKKIEYRNRPTKVIGQRFYIYASKGRGAGGEGRGEGTKGSDLPRGVIVGTARISKCTKGGSFFHWHLTDVKRLSRPRKPTKRPQPVWFRPF